jgi:DNA-binding CsgD family transcriptional regulator
MDEAAIAALIERIYDMALEPALWPELLSGLATILGANAGSIEQEHVVSQRGAGLTVGLDPSAVPQYFEYYAARNVLRRVTNFAERIKSFTPIITLDQDTMSKDRLMRAEFYADFLRPAGIHSVLTLGLWREGPSVTALSLYRPRNRASFDESARTVATILLPHLVRAFRIGRKIADGGAMQAGLTAALDQSPLGVLILGGGDLHYANAQALSLLAEPGGLSLCGGALVAADVADTDRLRAMMASAQRGPHRVGGGVTVRRAGGRAPLSVVATPLGAERFSVFQAEPGVMVCLTDPESGAVPDTLLREAIGLTAAEARIARMLVEGRSLRGAAEDLDISYSTVRNHLQHIFEKTGATRQAELVALLARTAKQPTAL